MIDCFMELLKEIIYKLIQFFVIALLIYFIPLYFIYNKQKQIINRIEKIEQTLQNPQTITH